MKASLDTNAIIHFYKANLQDILFEMFEDGVFIYEQIRNVELENHARDLLQYIDEDINNGKIYVYTDDKLKELGVYEVFIYNVRENRQLYTPSDLGEVYAISLAQIVGGYSLVTDDIKQGGPYMSLLQLKYEDLIPFTFVDVLLIRFLIGNVNAHQTIKDFDIINQKSQLNWNFKTHIKNFIRRFFKDPYKEEDVEFINKLIEQYGIKIKSKFIEINKLL